jgi:hypothetical protein
MPSRTRINIDGSPLHIATRAIVAKRQHPGIDDVQSSSSAGPMPNAGESNSPTPGTRAERALNGRMNEIAAVGRIDNDRIVPVDGWRQLPESGNARLRRAAAAIYPRTTCPWRRAVR